MPKFSKKEALSCGWSLFKANLFFLLGVTIISFVVGFLPTALSNFYSQQTLISIVVSFVFWLIGLVISIGIIKISLNLIDGRMASYTDLFTHWKLVIKYLVAQILVGVMVLVGLVLLVIPGIIFGIRLQFAPYLVVDKNMGPLAAVKASWAMTSGSVLNLFLFGFLVGLVYLLGVLVIGVGLLVAVPIASLATAWVYRKLSL